ncbi:hypothetical protein AQUCO_00200100v1 [Aquilegia coerulea]|uniref:DUF1764 domain-containing protein n=1 Tax=Aquilegia coerulea TaxID=218851 RepID=A0A2G5F1V1_AQUCA|nr:hypothetical protein AQUCO_00200100v1 [Aquilegia coerulea]
MKKKGVLNEPVSKPEEPILEKKSEKNKQQEEPISEKKSGKKKRFTEIDEIFASFKKRKNPQEEIKKKKEDTATVSNPVKGWNMKEDKVSKPKVGLNPVKGWNMKEDTVVSSNPVKGRNVKEGTAASSNPVKEWNIREDKVSKPKKKSKVNEQGTYKPRKKTGDGLVVYTEEELGIGKSEAGGTPLCPFDCDCCY